MPEIDSIFKNLDEEDLKQKIVEELLNNEHNLETKTELSKPIKWSTLSVIKSFIEDKKLPNASSILEKFMKTSFTYLISKQREGRKEYILALNALTHLHDNREKEASKELVGQ